MKFLADMGIAQSTVKWLVEQGHEATHVRDLNLNRASDESIIATAREGGSIVLTCDLDFGDIMAISGEKSPGIIIFRLENSRSGNINRRLQQVLQESSAALSEGALIIVEDARHRVRLLPVT
jgi:predicted nuclease of predicted toxin-antitoxin system